MTHILKIYFKMQAPFIEESINDLASNGVEGQIADVLQITSAEIKKRKEKKREKAILFKRLNSLSASTSGCGQR